jgi:membrane associated rhomboid family serine protease
MLLPYGSDAPLYHLPYATVGLIVVNLLWHGISPPYEPSEAAFEQFVQHVEEQHADDSPNPFITEHEVEQMFIQELNEAPDAFKYPDWRMLQFGRFNPIQWITANFMHADWMHVIGNMIFLWGMGIIIEGKLGWWRYLLVYLLIGTAGYGAVQILMIGCGYGNALGASLPIYGLIVLAMLWAPVNDLNCLLFLGMFSRFVDVPIYLFALGYVLLQAVVFCFSGMNMGSEALHLVGAFVALPIGYYMLKRKLVDCEDYDAISVWYGRHELTRDERAQLDESSPEHQNKVANKRDEMLAQVKAIVHEQKNPVLAWTAHERMRHRFPDWQMPRELYHDIIRLFHEKGLGEQAEPAMVEYLRKFPLEQTVDVRLKLADMMIRGERPRQGLHLLSRLDLQTLSPKQQQIVPRLIDRAELRKREVEFEGSVEEC